MLKKYSITALFSLLLIFTGFTGAGFAETADAAMPAETAAALKAVEKVNAEINAEIAKVQEKAEKMHANYLEKLAGTSDAQEQDDAWNKYNAKVESEIAKLQEKTERMTHKGMEKAKAAGLKVEMYLIEVDFADRVKWIDPIRVIDW